MLPTGGQHRTDTRATATCGQVTAPAPAFHYASRQGPAVHNGRPGTKANLFNIMWLYIPGQSLRILVRSFNFMPPKQPALPSHACGICLLHRVKRGTGRPASFSQVHWHSPGASSAHLDSRTLQSSIYRPAEWLARVAR